MVNADIEIKLNDDNFFKSLRAFYSYEVSFRMYSRFLLLKIKIKRGKVIQTCYSMLNKSSGIIG